MELNPDLANTITILGVALIFILIVIAGAWYSSTGKEYIINTPQSQDKMAVIDYSLRSLLGNNWVYVLLVLTLLVAGCLYFLYLASINDIVTITLTQTQGNAFIIMIALLVFTITSYIIQRMYKDYVTGSEQDIPYYTTQEQTEAKKQRDLIIQVIGLGVFVLLLLWFAVWYIFMK